MRSASFMALLAALLTGCSSARSTPAPSPGNSNTNDHSGGVAEASAKPTCGLNNDSAPHIPADYVTFTPPAKGGSYVDALTKCTVVRLTDSAHNGFAEHHYYSTISPVNATDTLVMINDEDWEWPVVGVSGRTVVSARNMPSPAGHIVWDAKDGNVFWFAKSSSIMKGTIRGNKVTETKFHDFREYSEISFVDAWDVSEDGDHLLIVGKNAARTMDVFAFSISAQSKGGIYTTSCTAPEPLGNQPGCLHKLQFDGANNILITFREDGTRGETGSALWDGKFLSRIQNSTTHFSAGLDTAGNDVMIFDRYSDGRDPCPRGGGAVLMRINPISSITCLFDKDWASPHISYGGGPNQPWIAISFFDIRTPSPEYFDNNSHFVAPICTQTNTTTAGTCWYPNESEVVLVRIDAENDLAKTYRIVQTRSRSREGYWAQPHASISRDGKIVVFDSNMASAKKGCGAITNCSDVYLTRVR